MCCETNNNESCAGTHHVCCGHMPGHRRFLSREEKIELLEKYRNDLEKEIEGVKQRIEELKG